jgi:hypothetical protein
VNVQEGGNLAVNAVIGICAGHAVSGCIIGDKQPIDSEVQCKAY